MGECLHKKPGDVALVKYIALSYRRYIQQAFQYLLYQKVDKLQDQLEDSRKNFYEASGAPSEADTGRLTASLKTPRETLSIVNRTSLPPSGLSPPTNLSPSTWRPVIASCQSAYPAPSPSASSHAQSTVCTEMPFSSTSTPNTVAEKTRLECGESDSSVTQPAQSTDETANECACRALPNDVLLGRSKHAGNILFQKLVMDRKREYLAAGMSNRERLAREIVNDVHARQGRFLKRVEGSKGWWVPISSTDAMKKVRQSFFYTYQTDASPKDMTYYQSIAVKATIDDVLLGRGQRTIMNAGNVRFRQLISSRKPEYMASPHSEKDRIARNIKKGVEDRNGRFLEKLEGTEDTWVPVDEAVILKKIKLCFRYRHSETSVDQASVVLEAAKYLAGIHKITDRYSATKPTKFRNELCSREDNNQENDFDALLPHVLASVFVDSVTQPIHTADLRPDDVLICR